MKTYKTLNHLQKRLQKYDGTATINNLLWDDYGIKVGNKTYALLEYGGGAVCNLDYDYITFCNKRTGDTITIKYQCPAWLYGKQTKQFKFYGIETY